MGKNLNLEHPGEHVVEIFSDHWRKCSSCKAQILYNSKYFICNVSTCNRKRTGYVFCSVSCFERHLPMAKHRESYAIEEKSPSFAIWKLEIESSNKNRENTPPKNIELTAQTTHSLLRKKSNPDLATEPKRILHRPGANSQPTLNKIQEHEILIVVSKAKDYIKRHSEMNTSADCFSILSDHVRHLCDLAIEEAQKSGRKTVMARDFNKI